MLKTYLWLTLLLWGQNLDWAMAAQPALPAEPAASRSNGLPQEEEVNFDEEEDGLDSSAPIVATIPERPTTKFLVALPLILLALVACRVRKHPKESNRLEKKTCD